MSRKIPPEVRDVARRRRRRVAAGDAHELRLADRAVGHRGGDRRVAGVEAAVEADLERHAGRRHRGQRAVDLGQVERDRLLAEDRLAGARGLDDQVGVRVGAACRSRRRRRRAASSSSTLAAAGTPSCAGDAARGVLVRRPGPRSAAPPAPGARAARRACGRSARRRSRRCGPTVVVAHHSSRSETTSSQRPGRTDCSSAACTLDPLRPPPRSRARTAVPRRPRGRTRSPRSRRGPRSRCRSRCPGRSCRGRGSARRRRPSCSPSRRSSVDAGRAAAR